MVAKDEQKLRRRFERIESKLPHVTGRSTRWLRKPSSRWLRIPAGVFLIVGGIFSILPVLGIWMLPLGFMLLAHDLPFLQRPVRRALIWIERRWVQWKRSRERSR